MNKNFNKLLVSALLMTSLSANAQIKYYIKTAAGNGTQGYGPETSTQATASKISTPQGVAADDKGNFYIADEGNNRIRKVTSAGIISTVAGNGTAGYSGDNAAATAATLHFPYGVAVDHAGNLYIADNYNNVIRKVNTTGIITTFAGPGIATTLGDGGPATAAYLSSPASVAVDKNGNVFIADMGNGRIRKVDATGTITTYAGTTISGYNMDDVAATTAQLNLPSAVCVDTFGNVYIADKNNYRIRKVDVSSQIISTIAGTGATGYTGNGGLATAAKISYSTGIAADRFGNIFISDNQEVRKINAHDSINEYAGQYSFNDYKGDGGLADTSMLAGPQGLAVDTLGNLYIADQNNNRIRKVYQVNKVGVQQVGGQNSSVTVFPNPNKGTFTVKGSLNSAIDESVEISVINLTGEVIYKNTTAAHSGIINASIHLDESLPEGFYMLNIRSATANDVARFVIEK